MRPITNSLYTILAFVSLLTPPTHAEMESVLRVYNPVGGLSVTAGTATRLKIQGIGQNRSVTKNDLKIMRDNAVITVRCDPRDNEPIDLQIQVPFHFAFELTTNYGAIELTGLVHRALLRTDRGNIRISVPWRATRFRLDAHTQPVEFIKPASFKFLEKSIKTTNAQRTWRIRDRLASWRIAFGNIQVEANNPGHIELIDYTVPSDSPVKFPSQASDILSSLLTPTTLRHSPTARTESTEPAQARVETDPVFRSDVRMVNLLVAAFNEEGKPITNLQKHDFDVIEDGIPQRINAIESGETSFNLAILLDLSGSTQPDRMAMKTAAQRFVLIARSHDDVAVYALAGNAFHVVSRLTDEKDILRKTIARLPNASGASPLYDSIVLAYAEDFLYRPGERNALIVISDGIDNRVSGQEMPSRVSFKKLLRGAAEMNTLIYPVFLRSGERFGRGWSGRARKQMSKLAKTSGGRLFPARSIQDLEPIFPLIEKELRSVYSLSYYPKEQTFDGAWRKVDVQVKRRGISIRTRDGYYAR